MIALLHEPYLPLIRRALLAVTPRGIAKALDVGCGDGAKTHWLRECCTSDGLIIGLERDVNVLGSTQGISQIVGDAVNLPFADQTIDVIWCIAALALFSQPQQALAEMRRVLHPRGRLILLTAGEYWVRLRKHPLTVVQTLPPDIPLPPADGLGEEWTRLLRTAGFAQPQVRAYLLDSTAPAQAALLDSAELAAYINQTPFISPIAEPEVHLVLFVVKA
ncbi:MAG: class I SAM-dependent methyltransferase [Chloroflexus sp.]|uniref:class I SAM-dependent methyltransferase n=1 Tax=Chloroflexus sp. TaxID=1904827 RepID=UPI003D0BB6C7